MSTQRSVSRGSGKTVPVDAEKVKEKASIRNLDEYVELLYEDLQERVRGSSLILRLARCPDNLEELERNESVLSALARVLREDWKKSLELSTNIIYIFFCFSTYTKFHNVIVQYRIGSLCMEIIEYELRHYDAKKHNLETWKNPEKVVKDTSKSSDCLDTLMNEEKPKEMEPPRRRIPELKQRPKSGNWSSQSSSMSSSLRSLNSSYHENLSMALDSPVNGMSVSDVTTVGQKRTKEDFDKLNKQLKVYTMKQEQLLRVAFYLLLNIAENVTFEEKMRKKNIVKMLIKLLDRQNVEVLVLVVTFLKKLSIVKDNKDEMYELNIVEKLPRLLQTLYPDLIQVTLKLIFNLSFDGALRAKMIRIGLLPKLVTYLSDDKHHGIVVRILYHMSMDDKVKSMFTYTECVPLVTDMLILNLNPESDLELIALCINLALNKRNAQQMTENNRLHTLMTRAFKYQDSLLMKMIRNISHHESLRGHFVDFVGDLAKVLTDCDNEKFMVECLGILANLSLPDLDYSSLLQEYNLIPWIRDVLIPGKSSDDVVLDTVVFLGTCACDEACTMLLCKAEVITSLIELLKAKQEDDEMVLQIVFVFQQILRNESTRDYMIKETESPAYLIDLMHDKNPEIRKVCDYCLDKITLYDEEWATRLKLERFRNYNEQWINMVESYQEMEDNTYYDQFEDDDKQPYLTADYLDQCMLYQSEDSDNMRVNSAMSNGSRPLSRYSRDFEELDMPKSRRSNSDEMDKKITNTAELLTDLELE
ncbi:kinesin-associated protein 3 isoform X4 [Bradysia coprophila]|nr:kinesin-associated protein 3 isoform X4 [Bradysia coprophila]XP_037026203.1 kinesin-associated protein 3 isoform X4 [Bradysia coprophila]